MLALISPAKKLDTVVKHVELPHSAPALLDDVAELAMVTRRLKPADLKRLMKISDALADLNYQRFQAFTLPFTPENAKQAALAFTGDTYVGLDAATLSAADLVYAQDHLRILSGLYGLLRPLDLIQPYRLEMGIKLKTGRGEDLYDFWAGCITGEINALLTRTAEPVVINLASKEYISAVDASALRGRFITPVFKEVKSGVAKVIGLMAKRARGAMARTIITERLSDPEALKDFTAGGYRFMPALSNDRVWEFHRAA